MRARLRAVRQGFLERPSLDEPIALARFVSLDLETTGPRMLTDNVISIGAVAVTERTVRHDDAFEAVLRQRYSSASDNILIHQIGGQAQLAGLDPVEALVSCLEFINDSRVVAFRAEFDATVFRREVRAQLGLRAWPRFIPRRTDSGTDASDPITIEPTRHVAASRTAAASSGPTPTSRGAQVTRIAPSMPTSGRRSSHTAIDAPTSLRLAASGSACDRATTRRSASVGRPSVAET